MSTLYGLDFIPTANPRHLSASILCMKLVAAILSMTLGCGSTVGEQDALGPGTHSLTIRNQGYDWTYHVHIPMKAMEPMSLVLVLHGAGGSGMRNLENNGWRALAEQEGFAVLAPTGLPSRPGAAANFLTNPRVWNSGQLNENSIRTRIDDVRAISAMLDETMKRAKIDENRIYVCGHSNGAGMTFRLAAEIPERFAAAAPVAGQLAIENPKPKKALPTLFVIGTRDPLLPLEGGESRLPWGSRTTAPVKTWMETWANAIGAPTTPKRLESKPGLKIEEYSPGRDGAFLRVVYIEGHGHGWPGSIEADLPESAIGAKLKTYNATVELWNFFKQFSKK